MQASGDRATVGMTQPATTNTELATMAGLILAVDLGKFKSVACVYPPDGKHSFCALASTREEKRREACGLCLDSTGAS